MHKKSQLPVQEQPAPACLGEARLIDQRERQTLAKACMAGAEELHGIAASDRVRGKPSNQPLPVRASPVQLLSDQNPALRRGEVCGADSEIVE